jgi:hypothetical protein
MYPYLEFWTTAFPHPLARFLFRRTAPILAGRVFFTGGNRAVYRGYRCYRWGTVTVPSGSNRSQNSNLNMNSKK